MTKETKLFLINAAKRNLGDATDNLYRAQASFKGLDLSKEHGQSGQTRQSILQEYSDWVTQAKAFLEEIEEEFGEE